MNLPNLSRTFALLTLFVLMAVLSACTGSKGGNGGGTDNNTVASMISRINTYRTGGGGAALTEDSTLAQIAQAQADYNASHNLNSDEDGSGATIAEQVQAAGYNFSNIAYLFNNLGETATFNEWKNNTAYSHIMLDSGYTDVGVGTATGTNGTRRWVAIFATTGTPSNDTVAQMLQKLNDFRTANGAAPFTINDNLAIAAQAQANHNAAVQANDTTNGTEGIEQQVQDTGYSYGLMMWTVANGSADTALNIWTDTPTEHDQMLDSRLGDVGIGVASGGTKQWWVVIYAQPQP